MRKKKKGFMRVSKIGDRQREETKTSFKRNLFGSKEKYYFLYLLVIDSLTVITETYINLCDAMKGRFSLVFVFDS